MSVQNGRIALHYCYSADIEKVLMEKGSLVLLKDKVTAIKVNGFFIEYKRSKNNWVGFLKGSKIFNSNVIIMKNKKARVANNGESIIKSAPVSLTQSNKKLYSGIPA